MVKKKNESVNNEEAIKNLLIILARIQGVTPEAISKATGYSAKYIANTFTMKYLIGDKNKKEK